MKIGIDIGGSHIAVGLVDNGKVILKKERDFLEDEKNNIEEVIENEIKRYIQEVLECAGKKLKDIELIGIAAPGTTKEGMIVKADNLRLKNFNLVERLKRNFDFKDIFLRNDAKCAMLCEKEYGSLKKYDDAIFLCLGTGIGGAVIMNGELLKGKKYEAFEIGHMIIEKNGLDCKCGSKGCFETYASMRVLKEKVKFELGLKKITGEELYEIIKRGEVQELVNDFLTDLSFGMVSIVNIFEPEAICIGGSFAYFEDLLLKPLTKIMKQTKTFNNTVPDIIIAKMGNDAGIIGATII